MPGIVWETHQLLCFHYLNGFQPLDPGIRILPTPPRNGTKSSTMQSSRPADTERSTVPEHFLLPLTAARYPAPQRRPSICRSTRGPRHFRGNRLGAALKNGDIFPLPYCSHNP